MADIPWSKLKKVMRSKSYGILSTISKDGRPHSTGVLYALSDASLALYVLTDASSVKARNISRNLNVSFVIPVPRRLLPMVPASSIQFQGKAEMIPLNPDVKEAFSRSLALRQTFRSVEATLEKENGSRIIKITPDPFIFTYGIAVSVMGLIRNPDSAGAKVRVGS